MISLLVIFGCGSSASSDEMDTVNQTTIGGKPEDLQIVQDEINKNTAEDYGVQVDFTYISYGDYKDQMSLKIASGEEEEMVFAPIGVLDFMTHVKEELFYYQMITYQMILNLVLIKRSGIESQLMIRFIQFLLIKSKVRQCLLYSIVIW